MGKKNKTNLEKYDEYFAMLHKRHPDTLYSPDPAEREEEMENVPKLSMEELEILVNRPLPESEASEPAYVELHRQCIKFFYETLVPNEEFLKKLEAGEFDALNSFAEDGFAEDGFTEDGFAEDGFGRMEIPPMIEDESDYEWIR